MTRRLISQFELFFGVTEEDEADRLRSSYGLARACQLAEVLSGHSTPAPLRSFWWRVGYLLSQLQNEPWTVNPLGKQRVHEEGSRHKTIGKLTVAVLTPGGVRRISRAEYLAGLKGKG